MSVTAPTTERRVVLEGVSWGLYDALLREVGKRRVRLTYDEGRLEIMTLSPPHERAKIVLGRLVEAIAEELGVEAEGLGSWTLRRQDLLKGLEPDECYYVTSAESVIGKDDLDLRRDPPPDLAIEVDISRPDIAREPIYAALGVPELWTWDGRRLAFRERSAEGQYVPIEASLAFPTIVPADVERFVTLALASGQTAAVRALRDGLRTR
jgi:Uma2 family endonuclease